METRLQLKPKMFQLQQAKAQFFSCGVRILESRHTKPMEPKEWLRPNENWSEDLPLRAKMEKLKVILVFLDNGPGKCLTEPDLAYRL